MATTHGALSQQVTGRRESIADVSARLMVSPLTSYHLHYQKEAWRQRKPDFQQILVFYSRKQWQLSLEKCSESSWILKEVPNIMLFLVSQREGKSSARPALEKLAFPLRTSVTTLDQWRKARLSLAKCFRNRCLLGRAAGHHQPSFCSALKNDQEH